MTTTGKEKRLVISVAAGPDYKRLLDVTAPAMQAYASRVGADFIPVFDDQATPYMMAAKYRMLDHAKEYDRTLFLDSDVVVSPEAPNIFDVVPSDRLGVFDEYPIVKCHGGGHEWVQYEGDQLCDSQGIPRFEQTVMFNAGVFLIPRELLHLYEPASKPTPECWCSEQQWFTIKTLLSGHEPFYLDEKWNLSYVDRYFWQKAPSAHFIHINGSRPVDYRVSLLKRFVERNFERFDPPRGIGFLPNWITDPLPASEPQLDDKISAVWVYWAGGADGEELRYSMRSVERHFTGLKNIVLCGDRPDWYAGAMIDSPKFTKRQAKQKYGTGRWCKWVDSVIKLQKIIDSPFVTDNFLWLYDDTFFVRDISTAEASIPRCTRLLCAHPESQADGTWREVLRRTTLALHEAGRPARNYSHHGPVVYNKQKLQQTLDQFRPDKGPRAIESLYLNHHFDESQAKQLGHWMVYTQKPSETWQPHPQASVVNVGGFRKSVERAISKRFPNMSRVEASDVQVSPVSIPLSEFPVVPFTYRPALQTVNA